MVRIAARTGLAQTNRDRALAIRRSAEILLDVVAIGLEQTRVREADESASSSA